MPETPEGLQARLAAAGIAAETRHHPAVFTVAESQDLRGTLPGGLTKNLFLRPAKGEDLRIEANVQAGDVGGVGIALEAEVAQGALIRSPKWVVRAAAPDACGCSREGSGAAQGCTVAMAVRISGAWALLKLDGAEWGPARRW
jgi:hypothetical protein